MLITYVKMDVVPGLSVWITGDEWERGRQSQGHTRKLLFCISTCSIWQLHSQSSQTDICHTLEWAFRGSELWTAQGNEETPSQQALDKAQRHNPVHRQVEHWVKALKSTTFAQRRAENQPDGASSPPTDSFGMNFAVQCLKKSNLPRAMPRAVSGLTCPACCSRAGLQGQGDLIFAKWAKSVHSARTQPLLSPLPGLARCFSSSGKHPTNLLSFPGTWTSFEISSQPIGANRKINLRKLILKNN